MSHAVRAATVLLLVLSFAPHAASADVTAVNGSAYGYRLYNITIFGGPQAPIGPTPAVTLPPSGSAAPITATSLTGLAKIGPSTFFSSGPISVNTQGTTGPIGSVTSSVSITNTNTSGFEQFTAAGVASSATAFEGAVTGSTTITEGTLVIDGGNDINEDGVYTGPGEHAPVIVAVPTNPAPNTSYDTHVHLNTSSTEFNRFVFNEQILNPDGSLTVNAVHEYLIGPTVTGDLIIGQSVAGVTVIPEPTGLLGLAAMAMLGLRRRRFR